MGETGLDKLKTVLRVVSGNFLEMYDFFLFGIYARQIAHTFFPNDDPYASLMLTFLSFAAGFAMRPIGALDSRSLHRPDRAAQRPHRHALDHGVRHGPDRLRAVLRDHRRACAAAGRARPAAAGFFRRRRARRRLGLSLRNGDPRQQGLLCELAVGEPAGRGRRRRAARLRHRQPDGAAGRRRLGLAHSLLHRLRDRAVPLLDPPLSRGNRRSSRRARSIRPTLRSTRRSPPTGRWCWAAWRWS